MVSGKGVGGVVPGAAGLDLGSGEGKGQVELGQRESGLDMVVFLPFGPTTDIVALDEFRIQTKIHTYQSSLPVNLFAHMT